MLLRGREWVRGTTSTVVSFRFGGEPSGGGSPTRGANEKLDLLDKRVHAPAAGGLAAAREGGSVAEDDIGGLVLVGFTEEDALGGDDGNDARGGSSGRCGLEDACAGTTGIGHSAACGRREGGR